ncbi:glutathione S-transferase family protein [Sphingobium nicotianae]|uniref:Glutathione S-transferase family protein n=1 Tax=Sphingobium nicotianae TaxID=2782607 RepID=A0A9X1DA77_9SPHN|nr:glutathione S-transferase family protein [Sphingobium nicotianae]MBT2186250.1 glutathione S-transferase family protein [Sphingobium nicotianae]
MLRLIIGNRVYSSWSLRGWLAVKQSGLPFEEVVVSLYDEDWPARRTRPDLAPSAGKVPALWDGDIAVWDSLAIIDYLDAQTGGTLFWPKDNAALGLARSMAAEMHSGYQALRNEHSMNLRKSYPRVPSEAVAENIARIMELWTLARSRFGAGGDFLFGAFGAVDIMFSAVVTRFVTYDLPVAPAMQPYVAAMQAHPFMREWHECAMQESWQLPKFEQPG